MNKENFAFSFVAGRHHGPESWIFVQEWLRQHEWNSLAHNLPIEDAEMSLDDHAELVAEEEAKSGYGAFERVGWSWGANVIPRSAESISINGLIYVAPSFHESTIQSIADDEVPAPVHSIAYDAMRQHADPSDMPEEAKFAFYNQIEDEMLVALVIGGLRVHPRRQIEPALDYPSHLPAEAIVLGNDNTTLTASQIETADVLGIDYRILPESGHAPMFSRQKAKILGRYFIELAHKHSSQMVHA